MAGRYLITGVQLGLLISLSKNDSGVRQQLDDILQKHSVGESDDHIDTDIKKVKKLFREE